MPSWRRQACLMGVKVVAHGGKDALCGLLYADGLEVEGRAYHGQEVVNDVVEEERGEHDERTFQEFVVSAKEVEEAHHGYHGVIRGVTQVHQLAYSMLWEGLIECQGGLKAKDTVLEGCKVMVEIGEDAVEFVGVGVPTCQQRHLYHYAQHHGKAAGHEPVYGPHGGYDGHDAHPSPYHSVGVGHFSVGKAYK